jgi:hypothetical protein
VYTPTRHVWSSGPSVQRWPPHLSSENKYHFRFPEGGPSTQTLQEASLETSQIGKWHKSNWESKRNTPCAREGSVQADCLEGLGGQNLPSITDINIVPPPKNSKLFPLGTLCCPTPQEVGIRFSTCVVFFIGALYLKRPGPNLLGGLGGRPRKNQKLGQIGYRTN